MDAVIVDENHISLAHGIAAAVDDMGAVALSEIFQLDKVVGMGWRTDDMLLPLYDVIFIDKILSVFQPDTHDFILLHHIF